MVANTPLTGSDDTHASDDVEYDPITETYHVQCDWENPHTVSNTVVTAVAEITGNSLLEMPEPLYDVIDPDALDSLFNSSSEDYPRMAGQISFTFNDCQVTISATGEIVIKPTFV